MSLILVTGGAKSGKSEWAEYLAKKSNLSVIYVATAQKNDHDPEWMNKIKEHQKRRPQHWQTWEIPFNLPSHLSHLPLNHCILVDSLGTWVANELDKNAQTWEQTLQQLMINLKQNSSNIIFVAEETGWGVVPSYESGRLFRNRLGNLTRCLGEIANTVYLVVGGYAVDISSIGINLHQTFDS